MYIFTITLILALAIFAAIFLTAFTDLVDGALAALIAIIILLFLSFTSAAILYTHDENLKTKVSESVITEFDIQPVEDVNNLTVAEYNSLTKIGDNYYRGKKWQKYLASATEK